MKKRICFVISTPLTAKSFLENHFEKLQEEYDLYLVANLNETGYTDYSHQSLKEIKDIAIVRKIEILKDICALWKVFNYLRKRKFDLVITFTPKASLIGIVGAWFAGVQHRIRFFTGQVWHTKTGILRFVLKTLDKITVKLASQSIVDGNPQRDFLVENGIISRENSTVLGKGTISGIDVNKFSPNLKLRNALRESLDIKNEDIVFMFLGRLNVDKGIVDLAQAFAKLAQHHENVKLVIVGPDEEGIQDKLKEILNKKAYIMYGKTDSPQDILQICDVFCLPSHREAFGLSIIEASSCEKPIICSDTYGLQDSIIPAKTGLQHKTADIDSLLDKMKLMVGDETLRKRFGKEGRIYVLENFHKNRLTQLWADYFNKLLNNNIDSV